MVESCMRSRRQARKKGREGRKRTEEKCLCADALNSPTNSSPNLGGQTYFTSEISSANLKNGAPLGKNTTLCHLHHSLG